MNKKTCIFLLLLFCLFSANGQNTENESPTENNIPMFSGGFNLDVGNFDFTSFKNELNTYNTDLMSGNLVTYGYVFNGHITEKFSISNSVGINSTNDNFNDSIDVLNNVVMIGISSKYRLFSRKRFSISPTVGIRFYRYKLTNEIPESNNLLLDVRLKQFTMNAGLNLSYRFKKPEKILFIKTLYNEIGVSGGAIFKLHKNPFINDIKSSFQNNHPIDLIPFYFRVYYCIAIKTKN